MIPQNLEEVGYIPVYLVCCLNDPSRIIERYGHASGEQIDQMGEISWKVRVQILQPSEFPSEIIEGYKFISVSAHDYLILITLIIDECSFQL